MSHSSRAKFNHTSRIVYDLSHEPLISHSSETGRIFQFQLIDHKPIGANNIGPFKEVPDITLWQSRQNFTLNRPTDIENAFEKLVHTMGN